MKQRPPMSAAAVAGGVLALAALLVVSRLPQFLGGKLYPDGDECLVGLMGLRWLKAGEAPLLFWGQRYGLVTLEAGAAALGFALAGVGPLALKGSMLVLWGLGLVPLGLAMRRFASGHAAWLTMTLLLLCPAWLGWSMKARGGYLTGFLLTNIIIWLAARLAGRPDGVSEPATAAPAPADDRARARIHWLAMGILAALVFWSQPVWVPPMAAFLLLGVLSRRRHGEAVGIITAGFALVFGALWLATRHRYISWEPQVLVNMNAAKALADMPRRLWIYLTGSYFMDNVFPPGRWTTICAALWCAASISLWRPLRRWIRGARNRKPIYTYEQAALLGIIGTLVFTLDMTVLEFGFRYLLPIAGLLTMVLAGRLSGPFARNIAASPATSRWRWPAGIIIILFAITGSLAAREWRNPPGADSKIHGDLPPAAALRTLTQHLLALGIHHVYSMDPLLQWAIIFESNERIMARSYFPRDRFPPYSRAVEAARRTGRPLAVVGMVDKYKEAEGAVLSVKPPAPPPIFIDETFYLIPNASEALLRALPFDLNEVKAE